MTDQSGETKDVFRARRMIAGWPERIEAAQHVAGSGVPSVADPADTMGSRILLIRHGRSALPSPFGRLSRADLLAWRASYDAVEISADDSPPASVLSQVCGATMVVSSDLPRALTSARRLAPHSPIESSTLLREADLDIPRLRLMLPFTTWQVLIHARWGYDILRGVDARPELRRRADDAAQWLNGLARTAPVIAVITHGVFRRVLTEQLRRLSWRPPRFVRSYRHWSVWTLQLRDKKTPPNGEKPRPRS